MIFLSCVHFLGSKNLWTHIQKERERLMWNQILGKKRKLLYELSQSPGLWTRDQSFQETTQIACCFMYKSLWRNLTYSHWTTKLKYNGRNPHIWQCQNMYHMAHKKKLQNDWYYTRVLQTKKIEKNCGLRKEIPFQLPALFYGSKAFNGSQGNVHSEK